MKEVAILLLVALLLNGCGGSNSTPTQTAASGTWEAQMLGGDVQQGLSFIAAFNVSGSGGVLSISSFQFLTAGPCFLVNGGTVSGSVNNLVVNPTTFQVTGTLSFTVVSGGNTLTLTGPLTGQENGVTGTMLTNGLVTGTWSLTGGTGCNDTSGNTSFTMTQSST